jgi:hypothetical protein
MSTPQQDPLITLSYINPTHDHPLYSKHHPPFSQREIKDLVSALKTIDVDFYDCIESGEITWDKCIEIAYAIEDHLSDLAKTQWNQARWKWISEAFRFSGGVRVVTRERKGTDIPPYSR